MRSRSSRVRATRSRVCRRLAAANARKARCALGAGTGYGAWQRRSTAMTSGIRDHAADPRRGQRVRLRQRAQHRQIGLVRDGWNQRRRIRELDVGLVDHHQRPAREFARECENSRCGEHAAGGIARRAQEHQSRGRRQRGLRDRVEIGAEIPGAIDAAAPPRGARLASVRRPRTCRTPAASPVRHRARPRRRRAPADRSARRCRVRPAAAAARSRRDRTRPASSASGCGSG